MSAVQFIDQPVLVEAHLISEANPQPVAFAWQNTIHRIADVGRTWQEEQAGATWLCYLVRTTRGDTFELRLDRTAAQWRLMSAWLVARNA